MRIPATAMTNHLMWTRSGIVWATWRLSPLTYAYASKQKKELVKAHHQALFQSLRGEALLMGLCADLDPGEIVNRMLEGIPIDDAPDWRDEVLLTLDSLERFRLGTREFWLSVPLTAGSLQGRAMSAFRTADMAMRDALSLPVQLPGQKEIDLAMRMANDIEDRIPAAFKPTRSTAAEQVWIALHSQQRGLASDTVAPVPAPAPINEDRFAEADYTPFQMPSSMPNPWIDEGGQSDIDPKSGQQFLPFKRRYLKVQGSSAVEEPSYQVIQALVSGPKGGWMSPGVEWLSHVDQLPNVDVDWAVRLEITPAEEVKVRNKRAENALDEQYLQQEGSATITGGGSDLAEVAETLAAYHAALNRSDKEVEVQGTVLFAVGAPTSELAKAKAKFIADEYKRADFILEAPLGYQEALWWQMLPGVTTAKATRELAQITTGRDFASGVPMVSNELGDSKGFRFGTNTSTARHTPILRDPAGNIQADTNASFGVVAELGAGKSVLLKCDLGAVLDRLGRIVAIDRTEAREYAQFATSFGKGTAVVDLMEPTMTLDPLRVFGPRVGARMVQSLFATMLGIRPRDTKGVALSKLMEPDFAASHNITSLARLMQELQGMNSPETTELLDLLTMISSKDIGEVLFNDGLPPLDLDSRAIIFSTRGLALPDRSELELAHLFEEMPLEKIFGRSMYAMLMGITRQVCFMNPGELAGAYLDECHHITQSPEGLRDLKIGIRDGRKHNAFFALGSHDPEDFGDEQTRGLLRTRYVMRQTDVALARRAVTWLTGEEADPDLVRVVTEDLSPLGSDGKVAPERRGEGIMRDQSGTPGRFTKTLPEREDRRRAVMSTPSAVPA